MKKKKTLQLLRNMLVAAADATVAEMIPRKMACGCGHEHAHVPPTPEEIAELMKAIEDAGYKVESTPEGEIRILEK